MTACMLPCRTARLTDAPELRRLSDRLMSTQLRFEAVVVTLGDGFAVMQVVDEAAHAQQLVEEPRVAGGALDSHLSRHVGQALEGVDQGGAPVVAGSGGERALAEAAA